MNLNILDSGLSGTLVHSLVLHLVGHGYLCSPHCSEQVTGRRNPSLQSIPSLISSHLISLGSYEMSLREKEI